MSDKSDNASLHREHRQRMKLRFRETGTLGMQDYQMLEILLFYCIPQGDTNPLAHRLIEHFGSLANVLGAEEDELKKVPGIGDHTAFLLRFLPGLFKCYQLSRQMTNNHYKPFANVESVLEYVNASFLDTQRTETLLLLALNSRNELIKSFSQKNDYLSHGTADQTDINTQAIVSCLLACKATGCILAHFHPNGLLIPSPADARVTECESQILHRCGFRFYDHIIANESGSVSYAQKRHDPLFPPLAPDVFDPLFDPFQ